MGGRQKNACFVPQLGGVIKVPVAKGLCAGLGHQIAISAVLNLGQGPIPMEWIKRYEMRPIEGGMPQVWDGSGESSLTRLWVRDNPARALDFASLTALCDVFFPRVFVRRATLVPIGTVTMTIYFHADLAQLQASGSGYLLGQARAQAFRNGYFDHTAQLWSEAGVLLATTQQLVYYKS